MKIDNAIESVDGRPIGTWKIDLSLRAVSLNQDVPIRIEACMFNHIYIVSAVVLGCPICHILDHHS